MNAKTILQVALGSLLGLVACAPEAIQTNTDDLGGADAGGGGGGADAAPVTPVGRVTEGLVALYEFDGVAGSATVVDTSGVGAPLDLLIQDTDAVSWGGGALRVLATSLIQSDDPATKIFNACSISNELTVEAWAKPAAVASNGRIVSNAIDAASRNFQLKQQDDRFQSRVRTTADATGEAPEVATSLATAQNVLVQHIVTTRTAAGASSIYLDNVDGTVPVSPLVGATQVNWDPSYTLTIANEPSTDRPWLGELYLVAIYCRALSPEEIGRNFAAGY